MDDDAVSRAYARQMARFQAAYNQTAERAHRAAPHATRILDAATGPALYVPRLAELNPRASITALDLSAHMLKRAEETLADSGVKDRVALVQGSVLALPFADDSFDLVIASQLIHMIDDLAGFLTEARRVLVPGGVLVIADFRRDVPAWYRAIAHMSTAVLRLLRVPMDGMGPVIAAAYTPAELERALSQAGFSTPAVTAGVASMQAEAR